VGTPECGAGNSLACWAARTMAELHKQHIPVKLIVVIKIKIFPVIATVLAAVMLNSAREKSDIENSSSCPVLDHIEKYVGKTISIDGEYLSDYKERWIIRVNICHRDLAIGKISENSRTAFDSFSQYPTPTKRPDRVFATFTGTVIRVKPDFDQYFRDSGIRLNVLHISHVERLRPPPLHKMPRPR